ncbi:unnamed protein product [Rotaria socialis]|uniref:Uncharacterized protein n=1 Tax=Rotaria socialis TaxID=392032 RepID=A0A817YFN0_9BILA|nr:unnamed protein product [Rotaria socialis]
MIVDKYVFSNRCTSQYTTTTSYSNATVVVASTITYECGGACQDLPGAQLYSTSNINNNCTLAFSTTAVGYYVVSQDSADYFPILALILGIGIPLCLMLNILSCSCLPQWLDQTFLYVNYIIFVLKEI